MEDARKDERALLLQGCQNVAPLEEFDKKLRAGKPLKIKFGVDPTAPDLHLGHAVVLTKLRQFQDLGHEIIFLIGDFTSLIGDPTGKSKTRPPLSSEEVQANTTTYLAQVYKVLDPAKTTVRYNSSWLGSITLADWIKVCAKMTVARLIERDDFAQRLASGTSIGVHELLYPLLQGYDSVVLHADVELGATDQTFNLLVGRHLQEQFGQEPQVIITMPILPGLDGVQKMSKSLNNYVGLFEDAQVAYGKLMSISDELMWTYYVLLLATPEHEIATMKQGVAEGTLHPMKLKKEMARHIVVRFWSEEEALRAQEHFEAIFQHHDYTKATEVKIYASLANPCWIIDLLKELGAISGSSEGKRLIESGAVVIDEREIRDFKAEVTWKPNMIVRVGKKKVYKLA
jgi:tyrosyl-tRNA synthetase